MNLPTTPRFRFLAALVLVVSVPACAGDDEGATTSSPVESSAAAEEAGSTGAGSTSTTIASTLDGRMVEAALRGVYDRVVGTHQALVDAAGELAAVTRTSCGTDLPAVQAAFRATRLAWDAARRAYPIGAHVRLRLPAAVDWFPVDAAAIDVAAASDATMTAGEFDALGAPARGLRAIEYLLWSATPPAGRRCSYIHRAADSIVLKTAEVVDVLESEREALVTGGDKAVGDVLLALSEAIYRGCDEDLGIPAGRRIGMRAPDVSLVREGGAGMAMEDVRALMTEVTLGYRTGILPLLEARYPGEPDPMAFYFEEYQLTIEQVGDDLAAAIEQRITVVNDAVSACRELRTAIVTQVASLLGIVLVLPVGDGD